MWLPGEHYIPGGQNVMLTEFLGQIAIIRRRRRPRPRVPRLVYPFAFAAENMAHITQREPFLTIGGLCMSKYRMFFGSAEAARDPGDKARPTPEALKEALAWFRGNGQPR